MTKKSIPKLTGTTIKVIIEIVILVIFVWAFIQVRDLPAVYVTKVEVSQMKTELKQDIEKLIDPMKKQIQQIYGHLLGKK